MFWFDIQDEKKLFGQGMIYSIRERLKTTTPRLVRADSSVGRASLLPLTIAPSKSLFKLSVRQHGIRRTCEAKEQGCWCSADKQLRCRLYRAQVALPVVVIVV
jgi:hypothetical protein